MEKKEKLKQLTSQRALLELEAEALSADLNSVGPTGAPPAGLDASLVDSEGFPRSDIDIYEVKAKRLRLRTINTDYKEVMKQIEELLSQIFAEGGGALGGVSRVSETSDSQGGAAKATTATTQRIPFARVNAVSLESPAHEGGLLENDLIIQFGDVFCSFESDKSDAFGSIAGVMKAAHSNQNGIEIAVLRNGADEGDASVANVQVFPKTWSGRGLLGCHVVPIDN